MKIYIGFLLILLVPIIEAGITEKEIQSPVEGVLVKHVYRNRVKILEVVSPTKNAPAVYVNTTYTVNKQTRILSGRKQLAPMYPYTHIQSRWTKIQHPRLRIPNSALQTQDLEKNKPTGNMQKCSTIKIGQRHKLYF